MPEEKICPVVGAYIHAASDYWSHYSSDSRAHELYAEVLEAFDDLKEDPLARISDPATQKLRAFYCLHGLFILLRARLGEPILVLPLTREGIQSLIKFCSKTRDATEVALYVEQLKGSKIADLLKVTSDSLIGLSNAIVEAGEYLRPRLRTDGPLSGMGRFYVRGLIAVHEPSESFLRHARELINVSKANRGVLSR